MSIDAFLKIGSVQGESKDADHAGEIELESFSWGVNQPTLTGVGKGRSAGKANHGDFHFTMKTSSASPVLMMACAGGDHLGDAIVSVRRAGAGGDHQEYLQWTLSDVMVSSFQHGGSSGAEYPVDQVSLNFSKIKKDYKPLNDDGSLGGSVKGGWNLETNKKEA